MLLGSCVDFRASEGTYAYLGKIYASQQGFIHFSGIEEDVISVLTGTGYGNSMNEEVHSNDSNALDLVPRQGDVIYGRINKVEDRFVRVSILAIGETPLRASTHFTGIMFKEKVRDYDRDGLMMHKCFVPNDIIRARVVQEASGQGMSVLLSTLEDALGVKYAWS